MIVVDQRMPGMTGVEFLRRAKEPNVLGLIIITIGLEMILLGLVSWKFGADQRSLPFPISSYDSVVIGKLIAYGDTREQAIARMRVALSEMIVEGIKTNIPLHQELLLDEKFVRGGTSIHYLEEKMAALKQIQAEG